MTDPPSTKGERTREAIVAAALELFIEQGYHGTSMRRIADRAGLALGGIYNHFANKEEIFEAVVFSYHPFLIVADRLEGLEADSGEQLLRQVAHLIDAELRRRPALLNLMFIEFIELDGRHAPKVVERVMPRVWPFLQRVTAPPNRWRTENPIVLMRSLVGLLLSHSLVGAIVADTPLAEAGGTLDDYLDLYFHGLKAPDFGV